MIITSRSKRTRIFGIVKKTSSKSLKSDFQPILSLTRLSKKRLVSLQIKVRGDKKVSAQKYIGGSKTVMKERIGKKKKKIGKRNMIDGSVVPR